MARSRSPSWSLVVLVGASGRQVDVRPAALPATEICRRIRCRGLVSDDENAMEASKDAFDCCTSSRESGSRAAAHRSCDATNVQPDARKPLVRWRASTTACRSRSCSTCPSASATSGTVARPDRGLRPARRAQPERQLRQSLRGLQKEGVPPHLLIEA
jgi:protein phosphatase